MGKWLYRFCTVSVRYKVPPSTSEEMEMWMLQTNLLAQNAKPKDRSPFLDCYSCHSPPTDKKTVTKNTRREGGKKVKKGKCEMPKLFLLLLLLNLHTHIQFSKRWCSYFGWMLGRGRESHRLATTSRRGDSHFFPLFFFLLLFTPEHFGGQS